MDVQVDQARLDVVMRDALDHQTPEVRAELLELLADHDVKVWTGDDGRDETWVLTIAGNAVARVHRSRLEPDPRIQ